VEPVRKPEHLEVQEFWGEKWTRACCFKALFFLLPSPCILSFAWIKVQFHILEEGNSWAALKKGVLYGSGGGILNLSNEVLLGNPVPIWNLKCTILFNPHNHATEWEQLVPKVRQETEA
jgi:hypothetical protein